MVVKEDMTTEPNVVSVGLGECRLDNGQWTVLQDVRSWTVHLVVLRVKHAPQPQGGQGGGAMIFKPLHYASRQPNRRQYRRRPAGGVLPEASCRRRPAGGVLPGEYCRVSTAG